MHSAVRAIDILVLSQGPSLNSFRSTAARIPLAGRPGAARVLRASWALLGTYSGPNQNGDCGEAGKSQMYEGLRNEPEQATPRCPRSIPELISFRRHGWPKFSRHRTTLRRLWPTLGRHRTRLGREPAESRSTAIKLGPMASPPPRTPLQPMRTPQRMASPRPTESPHCIAAGHRADAAHGIAASHRADAAHGFATARTAAAAHRVAAAHGIAAAHSAAAAHGIAAARDIATAHGVAEAHGIIAAHAVPLRSR